METKINLKQEQLNTINRPTYRYNLAAKFFFLMMDLIAGKKTTLSKAKLLEILACIPYREWEIKKYYTTTRKYKKYNQVTQAQSIIEWGREAQDNEYNHLLIIHEKMKEDGEKEAWYLSLPIVFCVVFAYVILSKLVALISIKSAFHFNAQFEDHAEHIYAHFVSDNSQLETQKVTNLFVKKYADFDNWADVFRRIGLDERNHRNNSFFYCGKEEHIVSYIGMPKIK
jgi:demethoxyubiquinone hydroxylase (CLK1/Coq7/Cat5 family)